MQGQRGFLSCYANPFAKLDPDFCKRYVNVRVQKSGPFRRSEVGTNSIKTIIKTRTRIEMKYKLPILIKIGFLVFAIIIIGLAGFYYQAQKKAIQHDAEENLLSIARLKIDQIAAWRKDRLQERRWQQRERACRNFKR